eukprot:GHVU01145198.1.p1 GENE.GHVU01145198.1~~GHVU01145198.1.p1  ORF type:complete len:101 (-),score=6.96 GHVU01145198.1:833-1135(-)
MNCSVPYLGEGAYLACAFGRQIPLYALGQQPRISVIDPRYVMCTSVFDSGRDTEFNLGIDKDKYVKLSTASPQDFHKAIFYKRVTAGTPREKAPPEHCFD